ncbi:MAG: DUF308 domain-containing protein [Clostridiales Family XIII bacterium]|jgi:uncharacterized membrane protein HdeD (DUF308 family)|nr:DUF308 domain-containing protein [Clostridiales Family XIII bacterium]
MRIILFVSGLIPAAAGIFFLVNEGQTFAALAFVAGLALFAFGLLGALAYFVARAGLGVPGWVLADSLTALTLSAVTLQNRMAGDDIALSAFGVWLMAAGAMRIAGAADMSDGKFGFRFALAVLGLMSAAMGAYGFFRPFLPEIGMTGILGGIFLLQGVSAVALGAGLRRRRGAEAPAAAGKASARRRPRGKNPMKTSHSD